MNFLTTLTKVALLTFHQNPRKDLNSDECVYEKVIRCLVHEILHVKRQCRKCNNDMDLINLHYFITK